MVGSMRGLLVVNPRATTTSARVTDVIVNALSHELDLQVTMTTHRGHGFELGRAARAQGLDIVITLGGDGVVNEVVNGMLEEGIGETVPILATVPGGSGNVFARALGIPVDAGDVQLGLRYLTSFTTVLLIDPLDASVVRQVTEDASFVGAQLIIVAKSHLLADGSAASTALGGGSPPPLFIPRPEVEGPEFDALLVGLAAAERGAETGV